VVVEAALVRQEDASDGGCASADAGARVNGSGGTDCHASVHTAVVHAGGVHRDPNAMALVPEHKGSPYATSCRQASVVQVLAQLDGCNPSHHVDGVPSLEDPSPSPCPALALYPSPCPSRVDASSHN
jgi:hypothetical protein